MEAKKNTTLEKEFFDAVKGDHPVQVRVLLAANPELLNAYDYNSFGGTPLTVLTFGNNRSMIDLLLELGADLNRSSDWWPGPWNPVQSALSSGNTELATYLVERGAEVGVHEAAGLVLANRLEELLRVDSALVHARGGDGCTPLHFAGSKEVVDLLLAYGADLEARDVDHYSTAAQYLAQPRPEVARHLFDRGATPDIFSVVLSGDSKRFESMISDTPELLEARINQTMFPPGPDHDVHNIMTFVVGRDTNLLHTAAIGGHLQLMERLVELGLKVDSRGGYDEATALHMAAWRDDLDVAQKLIELGASIDLRSGEVHDNTPTGWAIVGGSVNVFCYLIDQGAVVQDYFRDSIEAGLRGEFQKYQKRPLENFEKMLKKLKEL